jgi:hypothetical protein
VGLRGAESEGRIDVKSREQTRDLRETGTEARDKTVKE